jgi:hypothetical protein
VVPLTAARREVAKMQLSVWGGLPKAEKHPKSRFSNNPLKYGEIVAFGLKATNISEGSAQRRGCCICIGFLVENQISHRRRGSPTISALSPARKSIDIVRELPRGGNRRTPWASDRVSLHLRRTLSTWRARGRNGVGSGTLGWDRLGPRGGPVDPVLDSSSEIQD